MRRLILWAAVVGTASTLAGSVGAGTRAAARDGGTFRVAMCASICWDYLDPALSATVAGAGLAEAWCSSLVRYPDKNPPAGYRLVPDLAARMPRISNGGRTYAFRIDKRARFSSGAPVTGFDVAHSLDRILDPRMQSPLSGLFASVAGAQDVLAGKAKTPSGVKATRTTITFRLTQPDGSFLNNLIALCVVPARLPVDPEGVGAPLPSPAPYYASDYVPGRRVVIVRNPFYRGPRPHHVARFDIDLTVSLSDVAGRVESGAADWGFMPTRVYGEIAADLAKRYGVNKSQFFVRRGLFLRLFVLNTSRPLFRNNPQLRRAVNFAVDRATLNAERGPYTGTPIDHYLSPDYPGYRPVRLYPLHGNVARARALARGHTRSRKAVVYVLNAPDAVAQAQTLQRNLKRIGINLTIQQFPGPLLFKKLATPGEPFDIGWIGWLDTPDPGILDCLFDGKWIGKDSGCNYSYFNSPRYNRMLDAASRLSGSARDRAFGRLDVLLARDAAPAVAYAYDNAMSLVSRRTGCIVLNPAFDVAAACLK